MKLATGENFSGFIEGGVGTQGCRTPSLDEP